MAAERSPERAEVSVRVPGKVNLFLAVRGVREDGFHEIASVLQTVSLYDELRAYLAGPPGWGQHPAARQRMRLDLVAAPLEGLPTGRENLVVQAGLALGRAAGVIDYRGEDAGRHAGSHTTVPRTVLELTKAIPIAGGMAGGSANAAATLVALNDLWRCGLSREALREIGAELGSDVPFCVLGGTAYASGRGTSLARVLCRGEFTWLVVPDREPLSTAAVYASWDAHCTPVAASADPVLQALRAADPVALGCALHNDLEPAAFALRPDLAARKQRLLEAGALGVVLSGSGPTLLALARDAAHAEAVGRAVEDSTHSRIVVTSPAGSPELRRPVADPR